MDHQPNMCGGTSVRPPAWIWAPHNRRRAFTLIELMSVVIILGIAVALGYPKYLDNVTRARNARATGELENITAELVGYHSTHQAFPPSLADIGRANLLDPWGNPYRYLSFATVRLNARGMPQGSRRDRFMVPINTYYDLYSMGKNGTTSVPLNSGEGRDDIIVARDGGFIGLAWKF
jgi:general secretion pathway protein G